MFCCNIHKIDRVLVMLKSINYPSYITKS